MNALGDDGAAEFDGLFAASREGIVRQMVLLTGDLTEAEDVTQEAFERAWLRWPTVRYCDSPEAWVRTVARRLAVSRWRRARNSAVAWSRRGTPQSEPAVDAEHLALINALQELPQRQRVVIVLYYLADLPVAQVALETGASVGAVKQQLFRGRAALAALLTDECPVDDRNPDPFEGSRHD